MKQPVEAAIARVQSVYGSWRRDTTVQQMRDDWERLFGLEDEGSYPEIEIFNEVPVAWIGKGDLSRDKIIIYLHGGGYQMGSIRSHAAMMKHLSSKAECAVLGVDYRLAPEHFFPAPIQDFMSVYDALIERGVSPNNIALAGDSAGGNLALAATLELKNQDEECPAAIAVMSPWTDLEALGESYTSRHEADPIHTRKMILRMAGIYLNGADAAQPLASPLNGDLSGLPPVLIQVGDRETVLSDATMLAAKIEAEGGAVECEVWDGMIHVFQQFPDLLPEANQAIDQMAEFLKTHLKIEH